MTRWLPPRVDRLQVDIVRMTPGRSAPEAESRGQGSEHCSCDDQPQQDEEQGEGERVEEISELSELPGLHDYAGIVGHLALPEVAPGVAGGKPNVLIPKPV